MSKMAFCVFHEVVRGEKVEETCDRPNFVEQELELCHRSDIACGSYHIVTSRTLRHALDSLLDFHVTANSAEPSWTILNNPLAHREAPVELRMCELQHFDLFKIP